jgi:hypothetical protein
MAFCTCNALNAARQFHTTTSDSFKQIGYIASAQETVQLNGLSVKHEVSCGQRHVLKTHGLGSEAADRRGSVGTM